MRLLALAAKVRWSRCTSSGPTAIWAGTVLAFVTVHGIGSLYLLSILAGDGGRAETALLGRGLITSAALLAGLSRFAPGYRPTTPPLPAFLPGGAVSRAGFGVLLDWFALPAGSALLFIAVVNLSPTLGIWEGLTGVATLAAVLGWERSLRLLIEYRPRLWPVHASFVAGTCALLIRALLDGDSGSILFWHSAAIGCLSVGHHILLARTTASGASGVGRRNDVGPRRTTPDGLAGLVRSTALSSGRYMIPLGIGLGLKVFVLLFLGEVVFDGIGQDPVIAAVFLMVASPLGVFTYGLNNAFGHVPRLYDTLHLHALRFDDFLRLYARLLQPALVVDAAATVAVTASTGRLDVQVAAVYAASLAVLVPIGLWASLLDARSVGREQFLRLRNNTSAIFSIGVSAPLVLLIALGTTSSHAPWILGGAAAAGVLLLHVSRSAGDRWRTAAGRRAYEALQP